MQSGNDFDYLHASKQQLFEELRRHRVSYESTFTLLQLRRLYIENLVDNGGDRVNLGEVDNSIEIPVNEGNEGNMAQPNDGQVNLQGDGNQIANLHGNQIEDGRGQRPIGEIEEEILRMDLEQRRREIENRAMETERDRLRLEVEMNELRRRNVNNMAREDHVERQQQVPLNREPEMQPWPHRRQTFDDIAYLAPFTGENAYGIAKFFIDFETAIAPLHWDEHFKFLSVRRLFKATAERFLRTIQAHTYLQTKEAMMGQFQRRLTANKVLGLLAARRQTLHYCPKGNCKRWRHM